ncbi:hypothetical protein HOY80DRAFT_186605 [Tuber brumale]|nr:hypothetical protein HOY80DRAFT_186605 [Tuber brumale]
MQISTKQTLVLYEQLPLLARPGPTTALLILSSCIFTYIFIFPLTSISKPAHEKAPPLSGLSRFISINGKILHDPCHDIWLENEYGISEAIAMNQFGEFWAEAMKLLRLQAKLKHASGTHEGGMRVFGKKIEEGKLGRGIKPVISKVGMGLVLRGQGEMAVKRLPPAGSLDGMGILNGRVKIGKEEAAQLLCYKRKVADTRNVFIKTVLRARSYGTAPRLLRFVTSRPPADVVHRY